MFKLESYVTPWLLGYLDQYVKLRPDDLQLSLWGGDAVLYNLDLRLDVLQKAMQLPIVFKSGHIHELRLHVPWTKLGSEPMVITINTVECIIKVRDTAYSDSCSVASNSSGGKGASSSNRTRRKLKRQATEDLPPGYLQSILNRVMNNVTFIVNNLILKFVEDDIVLSVNVKSAECYSCDRGWNRAFVDITPEDLNLRKMVNFSDLTVCLDKSDVDGHIKNYQEPMLYRCFLACRLHMTYDNVNAKLPTQTKVNILCDKLNGVISDVQLPMLLRLIELCLALYYGYLDVEADSDQDKEHSMALTKKESSVDLADDGGQEEDEEEGNENDENQGWAAWMWSMVPQILPEEEEEGSYHTTRHVDKAPVLSIGFYIQQASLTFKLTEHTSGKSQARGHKVTFHSFLVLQAEGLGLEILLQGITFFNVQFGLAHISLSSAGPCICGQSADTSAQDSLIAKCGTDNKVGELAYDWGSLFDPSCAQNQGRTTSYIVEREEHLGYYTEQYSQQRFGAFWLDYLSTLILPRTPHSGSQSSDSEAGEAMLFQQEASTCRFVFGPTLLRVTSTSVHRIQKLLGCAWNHQYEPYSSNKERKEGAERIQLTEAQLASLEESIPTCTYHITLLQPCIQLSGANHPACNVATKAYTTHTSRSSKAKTSPGTENVSQWMMELCVLAQRFDLQLLSPMYPGRLIKLVSNIAGPSSNLMYHCHSHTQLKVFSLQAGLQRKAQTGMTWRPVILMPPCSFAFYFRHLLLPRLWNNSHLSLWEHSYEVPQVNLTMSKASILALVQLLASWNQPPKSTPTALHQAIVSDLFPLPNEDAASLSVLELSVQGLELRGCHSPLVQAYTGSLSSVQLLLYTPGVDGVATAAGPVLCGPVDASPVMDRALFQQQPVSCLMEGAECIAFTVQKPHHTNTTEAPAVLMVSMQGLAGCVDPALLQWFRYSPRKRPVTKQPVSDLSSAVDMPLAKATSPLQTGGSHLSVRSGSSQTQPTTSRIFSHSHTPSNVQSLPKSSRLEEGALPDSELTFLDSLTKLLTSVFPLLQRMHVQVDVKSSCVFVPKTSVCVHEASRDIVANVQLLWRRGEVGEVVVLCLPSISVHSVANTAMDVLQDIPIITPPGALLGEKLPWTVEMSQWTAFTLHPAGVSRPVLEGLRVSSTLGATVRCNPPTSDTIQSLALCLHLNLQPLHLSLAHSQVAVLWRLVELVGAVVGNTWQLAQHCATQLFSASSERAGGGREKEGTAGSSQQEDEGSSSPHQQEQSVTGGTPDAGEAVTTEVSDEVSHSSPLHAMLTADCANDDDRSIKLSIWLQCVLPKMTVALFADNQSDEVFVMVEDMALSCDIHQVYSKLKATIGSLNIHKYSCSESGERVKESVCPVLLSTAGELPQQLYVHTNKAWGSDKQSSMSSSPHFSPQDSRSTDNSNCLFLLTYTRAQCKSVRRKMRKLDVELTSLSEKEDRPVGEGLFFHPFVSEVCVKMGEVDVVCHFPTIQQVLSLFQVAPTDCLRHQRTTSSPVRSPTSPRTQSDPSSRIPFASHTLPLVYVDVATVRLFVPVGAVLGEHAESESKAPSSSTLNHDFFLLKWTSMHMQPFADNPLPRYPVQRDLFHQAMQCGMTQQTGSCVEDRQYQLSLHGLALTSGLWADIVHTQKQNTYSAQLTTGVQIPALEWNNYLGHRPTVKEVELIPIVTAFDLCMVAAPPIEYTGVNRNQHTLVCGVTAELNVMTDLDLHLSAQQLCLMTSLADLTVQLVGSCVKTPPSTDKYSHSVIVCEDSGVASEMSAATPHPDPAAVRLVGADCGQKTMTISRPVPANVLLTAGRISLTLYSHVCLQSDSVTTPVHSSPPVGKKTPNKDRSRAKMASKDNFQSLTLGMPDRTEIDEDRDHDDCVSFSFLQPSLDTNPQVKLTRGSVCVQPFVYMYIAQPHTVLSIWPQDDKLELSCYDILLKGVKHGCIYPVSEQRVMPDHADFSVYWLETRAGQPDGVTGIPPCLLTLRVSSLLTMPVDVELKLERPVKVSLTDHTLPQVSHFLQCLMPDGHHDNPEKTPKESDSFYTQSSASESVTVGQPAWLATLVGTLRRASLRTDQVVLWLECVDREVTCGLVTSVEAVTINMEQSHNTGEGLQPKAQGSMCWKDIMVKTMYDKVHRPMVGPLTLEADILTRWPRTAGEVTPPQVVMAMQTGLVLLQLGQQQVLCLRQLLSALQPEAESCVPSSRKRNRAERSACCHSTQLSSYQPSHDDLRSGDFIFVHNDEGEGEGEWPHRGQAVISPGDPDSEADSVLTWAYPQPRLVTSLSTLPVPLSVHIGQSSTPTPTAPCKLQYWDECLEEFVTYASFELCEDSSSHVQLPQLQLPNIGVLAVAHVWRVVVCRPPSSSSTPSSGIHATERARAGGLMATQLAGSMCVDSAQVPHLVPSLQVSLAVGKLQLHLYNHLHFQGSEGRGQLAGYRHSPHLPQHQQWAVISVDNISMVSSHIPVPLARSFLQVSGEVGMEVLDYNSLTLQSVLDPVPLSASTTLHFHQQPTAVKADINGGQLQVHVGRSVLHTINTSVAAWTELGENTDDNMLVFAHLVICNNTQQTLRVGQAGTDENILLHSGHMYPYSWRSHSVKQLLHLCVDHPTWRWCAPVDVSSKGHCVRVVRTRDQRYTLIIQTTQLSPVHRKVVVSGQFLVCSRLSQALEVRFQLKEGEEGKGGYSTVMEGGRPAPSFVVEHEDMRGISVRLAGHQLPWSHTLHLSGNAMQSNQLLKVLLPDGVSYFHVWCRIFCQNFNETRQKLIFFSPLYVLRSHLPLPVHARLVTMHSKQQQVLEVSGQGQEYQLHCTGGDVTHQLSFQLGPNMVESSPPVVLSSGLVEQVEQKAVGEVDIQWLCQQQAPPMAQDWPYSTVQPSSVFEEKGRREEVEQASVDLNIQLSQYMAGCNTLLVDISPWCLITNLTPLPLVLLTDSRQLALPQGRSLAPPLVQELHLGCEQEGQVWEGAAIPLSGDEVQQHLYSPDLGKVLFLDGHVQLQLLLPPKRPGGLTQVVPLSVMSVVQQKMRVVTISERLRITNVSCWSLDAQLMAVPQRKEKAKPPFAKMVSREVPVSERSGKNQGSSALLDWQLVQDDIVGMEPVELVLYMSFRKTSLSCRSGAWWSPPVRIACGPEGCRNTVSVAGGGEENGEEGEGGWGGEGLCVSCVVEGALTYVVLSQDSNPMCWIHNACPFPLHYGQSLDRATFREGMTVQEETELVDAVPMVGTGCWSHYTMPYVNLRFPQMDSGTIPRLHVRAVLLATAPAATGQENDGASEPRLSEWSTGVALTPGDSIVSMHGMAHIKVNIQVKAMVYHVTFTVLNKAEVWAREVRSRIQDGGTVTRVDRAASPFPPALDATPADPKLEVATGEESSGGGGHGDDGDVAMTASERHGETFPSVTVGALLEGVVLTLQDDVTQPSVITQLMHVEIQPILLACYPVGGSLSSLCLALSAGNIHVDNVLAHQGLYDFPVILRPQQPHSPPLIQLGPQLDTAEAHALFKADSFLQVQLVLSKDLLLPAGYFLDSVEIAVRPLSIFFEDSFFYCLYQECLCLLPCGLKDDVRSGRRRSEGVVVEGRRLSCVPQAVWERARLHQHPLRVRHLRIHPVSLLLSVHASLHVFLATDHAPLSLGNFERHDLFTGTQQLAYTLAMHYITAAIFRAGIVVGSLDILGSPTGLVRSVSAGLTDLLRLPYHGLTHSPAAFVSGLFGGVSSLMRNVTAGVMTSVTNFASSVSRNMDRLSLDSGHQQRQEETRRQRPTGLSSGLQQGLTGFGLSLLGAVAGLVDQPLQSVIAQQSADSAPSAGSRAGSLMAGLGKGLVGVITKPIGGAAELLSQTGQGFLRGSGLRQHVRPRHSIEQTERAHLSTAWLKYPMKMLADSSLLLAVKALQQDRMEEGKEMVVLLTEDMVVVVDQDEDGQQQAFALSQLCCQSPAPAILLLLVTDTVFHLPAQMSSPNSRDRVAAFIKSSTNLTDGVEAAAAAMWVDGNGRSALDDNGAAVPMLASPDNGTTQQESNPAEGHSYCFRMDPHWCQLFVALFNMATNRQVGRGFSV